MKQIETRIAKRQTNKPFPFNEEIFQEILIDIATSSSGLPAILQGKEHYPSVPTFYSWLNAEKVSEGGNEDERSDVGDTRIDSSDSSDKCYSAGSNSVMDADIQERAISKLSRLERFERARDLRSIVLEDEVLTISDTPQIIPILKQCGNRMTVIQADSVEHRKLQVETRKWYLEKLNCRRFGKKVLLEGGDEPIQLVVRHIGGKE